jgi:hypothetical protein
VIVRAVAKSQPEVQRSDLTSAGIGKRRARRACSRLPGQVQGLW